MGKDQTWRRCYECGRFLSYEELKTAISYDPTSTIDWEPLDLVFIHADCSKPLDKTAQEVLK